MPNDREPLRRTLLSRLASLFGAALDLETTMRGVTEIFVPDFAEWCAVDIHDHGIATRIASDVVDEPGFEDVLGESRTLSPLRDAASAPARLLGENVARIFQVEELSQLPWPSRDARHQALIELMLPCSILLAPLRAGNAAFGLLTLVSIRGSRRYIADDCALVEDVAQRAASAIQTASLFRQLQDELRLREATGDELAAANLRHQALFEAIPISLWVFDPGTLRFLAVNDAATAQYGFTREEFLARTIRDIRAPEDQELLDESLARSDVHTAGVFTHRRKDGSTFLAEISAHPFRYGGREARVVSSQDVTDRVGAYEAMRIAEERHRLVSRATKEAIGEWDPATGRVEWSAAFYTLFHYERDEVVQTRAWCEARIHSDDRGRVVAELEDALARHDEVCTRMYRFHRGDGAYVHVADRAVIAYTDGAPDRVICSLADVTMEHQFGEQLATSQRMEAVGRLAGGIAHDFNNLLTAIRGFATFALEAQPPNDPARDDIEQVLQAADRAATLTKQLLAFSRRQVLQPQLVLVNDLLRALERMFTRVIGEDIELQSFLDRDVWPVVVDPGQFEQVIINLVVNARDAMPGGGLLTIESSNVVLDEAYTSSHAGTAPGEYVMVAVSDSGIGMDSQTLARVFEPFFTTKEREHGTGLGLATSYGIVRQSGGHIWVYSEPDKGCTFKVYLPRASADDSPKLRVGPVDVTRLEGDETILLVEDDERVRRVSSAALRRYGYRVLEAPAAEEALRHFAIEADAVRLVVTDVVLPRMSGMELVRELQRLRPAVRVLFVSGYTENAMDHQGRLDPGVDLLEKPFAPEALARRVRQVLDRG